MKTISVILPVYNVEPWIEECIESLKKQKLDGLEFIFVDDCSSDNSMKAVEEWVAVDKRVRIIRNEENIGQGASRNAGIEAAEGEYLSFVDRMTGYVMTFINSSMQVLKNMIAI